MFELLGPTVDAVAQMAREVGEVLEPEIILRTSEQLLEAITFIHETGYVHGGMLALSVEVVSITDLCRFKWGECCFHLQGFVAVDRREALRSSWGPRIRDIGTTGW